MCSQMSSYIAELCDMVPSCGSLPRRPDKLTILRMAVSHMRQLRLVSNAGAGGARPLSSFSPSSLLSSLLDSTLCTALDFRLARRAVRCGALVAPQPQLNLRAIDLTHLTNT